MTEEIWKDIPGYEGLYQVSNLGRVKSNGRYIEYPEEYRHGYYKRSKILTGYVTQYGYHMVNLMLNHKRRSISVHRLVAMAFIQNYSDTLDVDHINGVRKDNFVTNLRMCTRSENLRGSRKRPNTISKYKGVSKTKGRNKYEAFSSSINKKEKKIALGTYEIEKDAAIAVDKYVRQHYGEYGRYNFPKEGERGIN